MMNALKSYSSDEDSDTYIRPVKPVKDGDPGTNYDSVGMDISEDSDCEEKPVASISTKADSYKNCQSKNSAVSSHRENKGKHVTRDSRDNRESSSGSSRDSRESREHSSRGARQADERDRRHDRDDRRDRKHREYERRRGDYHHHHHHHHRHGRERAHRSRSRERHRSRSRSPDRRRVNDVRRDAQLKLAAMKAANPDFDQTDLLRQSMVEQIAEVEKQTGVTLPTYYNPATMNPLKLAEQERKKRLLWGNKNKPVAEEPSVTASTSFTGGLSDMKGALWANTTFNNDNDGKMAEKFKRLMGVKGKGGGAAAPSEEGRRDSDALKKQETLFVSMEKQYETARMVTHTNKGFGLGFSSSQTFVPKQ